VFTATPVTARDGGLTVTGELAIGASSVRLEIPVNVAQIADGALRFDGKTTISRKAAGVAWNKLGMIGGDAILHAQLTLKRATP
jgi:polyisoprenoid-binding protein YceI